VDGGVITFAPHLAAKSNRVSKLLDDIEGVPKGYLTNAHKTLWQAQQPQQQQPRAGHGSPATARVTAAAADGDAGSLRGGSTLTAGRKSTNSTARRSQAAGLPLVLDQPLVLPDLVAAAATATPPAAAALAGSIDSSAAAVAAGDGAASLLQQQQQAESLTSRPAGSSAAGTATPAPLASSAPLPSTPQPVLPLPQEAASNIIAEGVQSPLSLLGTPTGPKEPAAAATCTAGSKRDSGGALAAAVGEVSIAAAISMAAANAAPGAAAALPAATANNIIAEGVQSPLSLLGTPTGPEGPAAAAAAT